MGLYKVVAIYIVTYLLVRYVTSRYTHPFEGKLKAAYNTILLLSFYRNKFKHMFLDNFITVIS